MNSRTTSIALALALGSIAPACSPPPPTALVVRVDSNMAPDSELVSYQISARRVGEEAPLFDNSYALAMPANRLPATLAIIPRDVDDHRALEVVLTGRVSGQPSVVQRARVGIRYRHVALLDMFLARECIDAEARRICSDPMQQTCTRGGMCVAIDQQAPLPDYDAAVGDAAPIVSDIGSDTADDSRAADVGFDAPFDAGADVTVDEGLDATVDTGPDDVDVFVPPTDVGIDAPVDVGPPPDAGADAGPIVGGIGAPRAIGPLSTSRVHTSVPTLRWTLAGTAATGAVVDVCRDRAMTTSCIASVIATGSQSTVGPLADGTWFWRMRGTNATGRSSEISPTWQFTVHRAATPRDTSDGSILDLNGDGLADVAIGAPFESMGSGDVYVYYGRAGGVFTATADLTIPGSGYFGQGAASAGDVNGDGYGDLVVGASNGDRVYVYLGGPGGIATSPANTLSSPGAPNLFGEAVASAGDANGDGYADVVVSAATGAYLFAGGPSGLAATPTRTFAVSSGVTDARSVGDLDGDSRDEIAVAEGGANQVTIYYTTVSTTLVLMGTAPEASFGIAISGAGDINGDGIPDLAVSSAPGLGTPSPRFTAIVFTGGAGTLTHAATLALPETASSLSLDGDYDGDGFDDLVAGLPGDRGGDGSVMIYFGNSSAMPSGPLVCTTEETGYASYGRTTRWLGDSDGDGRDDLAAALDGLTFPRAYALSGVRSRSVCPTGTRLTGAPSSLFGTSIALAPRRRSVLPALFSSAFILP